MFQKDVASKSPDDLFVKLFKFETVGLTTEADKFLQQKVLLCYVLKRYVFARIRFKLYVLLCL